MAVLRYVCCDVDAVLLRDHIVFVVVLGAVLAHNFGFLDVNKNLVWQADMDKCVQSAPVFFKQLCFLQLVWIVNHDQTLLSIWR